MFLTYVIRCVCCAAVDIMRVLNNKYTPYHYTHIWCSVQQKSEPLNYFVFSHSWKCSGLDEHICSYILLFRWNIVWKNSIADALKSLWHSLLPSILFNEHRIFFLANQLEIIKWHNMFDSRTVCFLPSFAALISSRVCTCTHSRRHLSTICSNPQ